MSGPAKMFCGKIWLEFLAVGALFATVAESQWIGNCPRKVTWSLEDSTTNRSCILLTGSYDFLVPYSRISGATVVNSTAIVSLSSNATVTGSCGSAISREEQITLTWPTPEFNSTEAHTVTFVFSRNSTTGSPDEGYFCIQRVTATLHSNPVEFRDDVEPGKIHTLQGEKLEALSTPLGLSYFCSSSQELPLGEGKLRLEHTQFEIFHKTPLQDDGTDFSSRSYCLADGLRMLVTAIVLISLLVGTGVFVIYLFRRRSKKSSYNSLD